MSQFQSEDITETNPLNYGLIDADSEISVTILSNKVLSAASNIEDFHSVMKIYRLAVAEKDMMRSSLKEAKRIYQAKCEELKIARQAIDRMREARDTAEKQCHEQAVRADELEREADKARRVIAGNTDIENNGSLLDMLNQLGEYYKGARRVIKDAYKATGGIADDPEGSLTPRIQQMREALEQALEFFKDREDVLDGPDGRPKPNEAMKLARLIKEALGK